MQFCIAYLQAFISSIVDMVELELFPKNRRWIDTNDAINLQSDNVKKKSKKPQQIMTPQPYLSSSMLLIICVSFGAVCCNRRRWSVMWWLLWHQNKRRPKFEHPQACQHTYHIHRRTQPPELHTQQRSNAVFKSCWQNLGLISVVR
jgi:hypothetical protein